MAPPAPKAVPKPMVVANGKVAQTKQMSVVEVKGFEPYFARIKNGVAEIVGQAGEMLVYIEVKISELGQAGKVWVLGMAERIRKRAEPLLQPVLAKIAIMYNDAKNRAGATFRPLYAKIVDGVLYVQGKMADYTINIKANAAEIWTRAVVAASDRYALVQKTVEAGTEPVVLWTKEKYAVASTKFFAISAAASSRAKDGCMYVQMKVGDTVVYIRAGMLDGTNRVSSLTLAAYNKACGVVSPYVKPIIEKAVAMYQQLSEKVLTTLDPVISKVKKGVVDMKVQLLGVSARVRARALAAGRAAGEVPTACYVKVKNGFVYIQGRVGDRIVIMKVYIAELAAVLQEKASDFKVESRTQLLALTNYAKAKSAALSDRVRVTVSDTHVQVTAASAVGGAATMGASGGATGLVAGGAIGAACGVVPAVFTFGRSIPIGAALGGAAGLCMGTVAGGTVGLVGGGAAGRKGYENRAEIQEGVSGALAKANNYKSLVAEKASDCKYIVAEKASGYKELVAQKASVTKGFVTEKTEHVRTRLVGGTGGTA